MQRERKNRKDRRKKGDRTRERINEKILLGKQTRRKTEKKENSDETNTRRRRRFMGVKRDGGKSRQIMRRQCFEGKCYQKIQFERYRQKMLFGCLEIITIHNAYQSYYSKY